MTRHSETPALVALTPGGLALARRLQRELGAAVGVNATTICRIERGNRTPLAITCALIARELGVPMERLLHD